MSLYIWPSSLNPVTLLGVPRHPAGFEKFKPESEEQLRVAISKCIQTSPTGDCAEGPHGSIGDWDVSAVIDMASMFSAAYTFNQDLSKWDVSAVTHMGYMFYGAVSFNRELCSYAWVYSKAEKRGMFTDSPGSISTVCKTARPGIGEIYG